MIRPASPVAVVLLLDAAYFLNRGWIALGFITYTIAKLVSGRYKEVSPQGLGVNGDFIGKIDFFKLING